MTEWKLFDGELPEPPWYLQGRPWMNLEDQPGFDQRADLVAGLAGLVLGICPSVETVSDLGCGDGSLLARISLPAGRRAWGYELGAGDVAYARDRGLDVRQGDILDEGLKFGDLVIASEVLEHIEDPTRFLWGLGGAGLLIASSPSLEHGGWHNDIHAWAWDLDGYRDLMERSGWRVLYQAECDGGQNTFGGVTGPQRFQAVVARR